MFSGPVLRKGSLKVENGRVTRVERSQDDFQFRMLNSVQALEVKNLFDQTAEGFDEFADDSKCEEQGGYDRTDGEQDEGWDVGASDLEGVQPIDKVQKPRSEEH